VVAAGVEQADRAPRAAAAPRLGPLLAVLDDRHKAPVGPTPAAARSHARRARGARAARAGPADARGRAVEAGRGGAHLPASSAVLYT